jgi:hypothetical protein
MTTAVMVLMAVMVVFAGRKNGAYHCRNREKRQQHCDEFDAPGFHRFLRNFVILRKNLMSPYEIIRTTKSIASFI